ncbi:Fe-S cluster assembly protein SufD [Thermocoleostomius sinensis]|uniref:Fe-S cluster assembly protein SufD n=1 Tax=Thermocoleostomius sinensis A174 TaxID=2016057 RepID=A0A9E8ZDZ0_9CYAN|nr:Fe-S cluster assembly protein SufD [Thermocoleostomius sinensis]WAL61569.1 Fe-S cluster assembly protein SufD [Thermocoleostomius sinensis A174]
MSIQASAPEQTGVRNAAQQRLEFLSHLLNLAKQAPVQSGWLQDLRNRAAIRVSEQAFPTTRDEEWRFTDLSDLVRLKLEAASDHYSSANLDSVNSFALPETSARLTFINGVYAAEFSTIGQLPPGLIISNLSGLTGTDRFHAYLGQQSGAEEVFTALNTAGLSDAAIVFVPKNLVVEAPVHLLFINTTRSTAALIQPRCLIVAEANSAITLVEAYETIGEGTSFTNAVTEIWLAENAEVNHTRLQRDNLAAFHIGKTAIAQARDSRYTGNTINLGAKLSRHNLEVYQTGEQTQTTLNNLTRIHGEQTSDTHSTIALTHPYGTTRQLHKCIIDDRAHAIFNGKVFVPQAAQLTDAGQLNRNLLLSPKARVDTKPQLEIVADNVKCTHGAAVGQLDANEIFYLQSRGIPAAEARHLLVSAFAQEIIDRIPIDSLQQQLSQ